MAPPIAGAGNFAATFPIYDLLFATFHPPPGRRPERYGSGEPGYPSGFLRQLIQPFRR